MIVIGSTVTKFLLSFRNVKVLEITKWGFNPFFCKQYFNLTQIACIKLYKITLVQNDL